MIFISREVVTPVTLTAMMKMKQQMSPLTSLTLKIWARSWATSRLPRYFTSIQFIQQYCLRIFCDLQPFYFEVNNKIVNMCFVVNSYMKTFINMPYSYYEASVPKESYLR